VLASFGEHLQLPPDVLLMLCINLVRSRHGLLQVDAAESYVATLIAKKACALLDRVSVPDARASRHVGHSKAIYRESSVEDRPADENPVVLLTPRDVPDLGFAV
jgi:hypothetical protein